MTTPLAGLLAVAILAGPAGWLLQPMISTAVVYVFAIVALRLAGKRLLAQLNPFDLVVLLLLSNTLQDAMVGDHLRTLPVGLVSAATLLVVNALVVRFFGRHQRIERVVEGGADPLIVNGRIQTDALVRERITESELRAAAHRQGFESLAEIDSAELEPGGILAFQRRHETDDHAQHLAVIERLERIERLLEGRVARGWDEH